MDKIDKIRLDSIRSNISRSDAIRSNQIPSDLIRLDPTPLELTLSIYGRLRTQGDLSN